MTSPDQPVFERLQKEVLWDNKVTAGIEYARQEVLAAIDRRIELIEEMQ